MYGLLEYQFFKFDGEMIKNILIPNYKHYLILQNSKSKFQKLKFLKFILNN